jgi:hypothetical protein
LSNYSRGNNYVRSVELILYCVYFKRDPSSSTVVLMNTFWCSEKSYSLFNYSSGNNYVGSVKVLLCCVYFKRDLSSSPCCIDEHVLVFCKRVIQCLIIQEGIIMLGL